MKSQSERENTNIVVDCSTLAYAAYHAYGHLSYNDEPTGVIFGFLTKILILAKEFKTNRFIFCWDSQWTHRENDYKGYKEKRHTRKKELPPEELAAQLSVVDQREVLRKEALPVLGFRNSFLVEGFEADDLLAVFTRKLSPRFPVIMVTTDTDMYQCLDCCSIYNPSKKEIFSEEKFRMKFGIRPDQWAMAKAIGGCDTDEVAGIDGVADPKKSTSKSLKYMRGELGKGLILARIEGSEGQSIIKRNLPIVTTPYKPEKLPRMILRRDKFEVGNFINVFERYGLYSFLKATKLNEWKEWFL